MTKKYRTNIQTWQIELAEATWLREHGHEVILKNGMKKLLTSRLPLGYKLWKASGTVY